MIFDLNEEWQVFWANCLFCIYLHPDMKNLLRYIIPLLIFAALINAAGSGDSSSEQGIRHSDTMQSADFSGFLHSSDFDLSVPRTVSLSSSFRVSGNARRTVNTHNRSHFEFLKSGKIYSASILYSFQRNSVILNTTLIEHSYKLVYLGKLII